MRPTQELAQTALFTQHPEGLSVPDRIKLSYERARAVGRAYGMCIWLYSRHATFDVAFQLLRRKTCSSFLPSSGNYILIPLRVLMAPLQPSSPSSITFVPEPWRLTYLNNPVSHLFFNAYWILKSRKHRRFIAPTTIVSLTFWFFTAGSTVSPRLDTAWMSFT
jgi:hypothetical protein